jgi:hypothetical protein
MGSPIVVCLEKVVGSKKRDDKEFFAMNEMNV